MKRAVIKGIDGRVIALRLMPEERAEAVRLAHQFGLTYSALARLAYLRGLPLVVEEVEAQQAPGYTDGTTS